MTINISTNKKKVTFISTLFILSAFVYIIYCVQAQNNFNKGKAALNTKEWRTAWYYFERATGFYKFGYPSHVSEAQLLKDQCSLLIYGENKRKQGEFGIALNAYTAYLSLYPESAKQQQIHVLVGETYMEWGEMLRKNNQPDLASEKYQTILDTLSNTPAYSKALTALGPTLLEWAFVLQENHQYLREIELINKITTDFSNTSGVDNAYKAAIQGLASDTGTDGQQTIADTQESICEDPYGHAASPAIGVFTNQPAKGRVCMNTGFDLPVEWQATVPGNFQYIVLVSKSYEDIQTCMYNETGTPSTFGNYQLLVSQEEAKVTIYSTVSGGILDSKTFSGPSNYQCPNVRMFASTVEHLNVGSVDTQDLLDWLKAFFK